MFKDVKIEMPATMSLIIMALFGTVMIYGMFRTGSLDADFKQTLFSITLLAVGFWLGSSSDSRKKTDALLNPPPGSTPPAPEPKP